ncbi:hypothetical protein FHT44_006195 [Mycolicibacterium sp. BK634]|uniref:hypothetical protein n=1 Tax=Mycolicibacterium sp. BK634 TaxID=2587099 RepID=UPI0016155F7C|nr:hypothetical protein [Mycolicibacterium sp. BK634]MBB3753673.1 hypothetical protein [Mycolicibacterium sp. BK634]
MSDFIPNLSELASFLKTDSDAARLVAAFSATSLEEARADLRRIAGGWEASEDRSTYTNEAQA